MPKLPSRIFGPLSLLSALSGLLLFCAPVWSQNLYLSLANQPPVSGQFSTRDQQNLSFTVMSGSTVSFARSNGRDYRLQAGGGFFWTQVQELPRDADSVMLAPTLQDDGSIQVVVHVPRKADQQQQSYSSTLVAQPGEWLQLLGPANQQPRGSTIYGTQTVAQDTLFLLVESP